MPLVTSSAPSLLSGSGVRALPRSLKPLNKINTAKRERIIAIDISSLEALLDDSESARDARRRNCIATSNLPFMIKV
jgi:hypothetical protein